MKRSHDCKPVKIALLELTEKGCSCMNHNEASALKKPSAVTFVQVLMYFTAVINVVNGFLSFGSTGLFKKTLCIAMILVGCAAVYVAARLNKPSESNRRAAIVLSGILIALRIVEFAVWYDIGFLIGMILPVFVIWRLNRSEARSWFR